MKMYVTYELICFLTPQEHVWNCMLHIKLQMFFKHEIAAEKGGTHGWDLKRVLRSFHVVLCWTETGKQSTDLAASKSSLHPCNMSSNFLYWPFGFNLPEKIGHWGSASESETTNQYSVSFIPILVVSSLDHVFSQSSCFPVSCSEL